MRRAIAAAVVGGLVLGGVMAMPAFAATARTRYRHSRPQPSEADRTKYDRDKKATAMKTVVYHGLRVPGPGELAGVPA